MWYIWIMEYYSAIKRNEVEMHATTWMNQENTDAKWMKPDIKVHIFYDSVYMKCPG